MPLPPLTTRFLARTALLVSLAALILSLARVRALPHAPVRTALAAAPKTALSHTLTTRDPAAAVSYYLTKQSKDLTTYTHPVYGFSFPYLKDFTVQNIQEEGGELVLVENPTVGMGLQIFITPDEETETLTATRIRHDLPDMAMDEVMEFLLPDDTSAVRFVSHDAVLGDVGETWFRKDGHIFQLSVSAPDRQLQDAWVRNIAATLTFPDDGTANASTQQQ